MALLAFLATPVSYVIADVLVSGPSWARTWLLRRTLIQDALRHLVEED